MEQRASRLVNANGARGRRGGGQEHHSQLDGNQGAEEHPGDHGRFREAVDGPIRRPPAQRQANEQQSDVSAARASHLPAPRRRQALEGKDRSGTRGHPHRKNHFERQVWAYSRYADYRRPLRGCLRHMSSRVASHVDDQVANVPDTSFSAVAAVLPVLVVLSIVAVPIMAMPPATPKPARPMVPAEPSVTVPAGAVPFGSPPAPGRAGPCRPGQACEIGKSGTTHSASSGRDSPYGCSDYSRERVFSRSRSRHCSHARAYARERSAVDFDRRRISAAWTLVKPEKTRSWTNPPSSGLSWRSRFDTAPCIAFGPTASTGAWV